MPIQDFKHNHYVPEWYQKRFCRLGNTGIRISISPEVVVHDGHCTPVAISISVVNPLRG
jgi:hypothetical protein